MVPVCFLKGTMICLVSEGEGKTRALVEDLRVGDSIACVDGTAKKIIFIGKQVFDLETAPEARPITISRGALGANSPSTDLHLSPLHSVWDGSSWKRAAELINGTTVIQMENPPSIVKYYNIELEDWGAIFANDAICESYRDLGNRNEFHYSAMTVEESELISRI